RRGGSGVRRATARDEISQRSQRIAIDRENRENRCRDPGPRVASRLKPMTLIPRSNRPAPSMSARRSRQDVRRRSGAWAPCDERLGPTRRLVVVVPAALAMGASVTLVGWRARAEGVVPRRRFGGGELALAPSRS